MWQNIRAKKMNNDRRWRDSNRLPGRFVHHLCPYLPVPVRSIVNVFSVFPICDCEVIILTWRKSWYPTCIDSIQICVSIFHLLHIRWEETTITARNVSTTSTRLILGCVSTNYRNHLPPLTDKQSRIRTMHSSTSTNCQLTRVNLTKRIKKVLT